MPSKNLIMTRSHDIYKTVYDQLVLNNLLFSGGKQYVKARLQRHPNESNLSWDGFSRMSNVSSSTGRKNRAVLVNDGGRIVSKINQYIFAEDANRSGIDPQFESNVDGKSTSIREFWEQINQNYTIGGWVWINYDRQSPIVNEETNEIQSLSMAQKEQLGDRIYWNYVPAISVPDWAYDDDGNLIWLLIQEEHYNNLDPAKEATKYNTRTLWVRGSGGSGATYKTYITNKSGEDQEVLSGSISIQEIPYILMGRPQKNWWFDSVEMVQAQLLNLDSLHTENLIKTVYPQLVLSKSSLDNLEMKLQERMGMSGGQRIVEVVKEVIRGLDSPLIEAMEEKGITRYLTVRQADLEALPLEIERKRKLMFQTVGLNLFNQETRLVQTAESKKFDHLDIESTLRHRSSLLQETEELLIQKSLTLDSTFTAYSPQWPMDFSVDQNEDTLKGTNID